MANIRERPQSLKEFIEENKEHEGLIKKAVKVSRDFNFYLTDCLCEICDKVLTQNELLTIPATHFARTCTLHRDQGTFFQIQDVRERLGFKKRDILTDTIL